MALFCQGCASARSNSEMAEFSLGRILIHTASVLKRIPMWNI